MPVIAVSVSPSVGSPSLVGMQVGFQTTLLQCGFSDAADDFQTKAQCTEVPPCADLRFIHNKCQMQRFSACFTLVCLLQSWARVFKAWGIAVDAHTSLYRKIGEQLSYGLEDDWLDR